MNTVKRYTATEVRFSTQGGNYVSEADFVATEQRIADAIGKLVLAASMMDDDERGNRFAKVCRIVVATLKPTEEVALDEQ